MLIGKFTRDKYGRNWSFNIAVNFWLDLLQVLVGARVYLRQAVVLFPFRYSR